jgi:hypothetical protein
LNIFCYNGGFPLTHPKIATQGPHAREQSPEIRREDPRKEIRCETGRRETRRRETRCGQKTGRQGGQARRHKAIEATCPTEACRQGRRKSSCREKASSKALREKTGA